MCTQGGEDEDSYAKNCESQATAIALSRPFLTEAIDTLELELFEGETSIRIADLGCATGYNTINTMALTAEALRRRYEREFALVPEFEVFFSDLPSNDFNTLFQSLQSSIDGTKMPFYTAGVPGSFYTRLFPRGKLHFVVSLNALHWLSKIPDAVLDKHSPAWNKGLVWIDRAKKEVVDAYAKQSEEDLIAFLQCRREEIAKGGILFLLMGGRSAKQAPVNQIGDAVSRAKHPFTTPMEQAWDDLLNEGLIDEDTRDSFNIPSYMRSTDEIKVAFDRCSGFEIQILEFQRIAEHTKEKQEEFIADPVSYARSKTGMVRAGMKAMFESHLGPLLCNELLKRFEERVAQDIPMLYKTCYYGVIIVCATRK